MVRRLVASGRAFTTAAVLVTLVCARAASAGKGDGPPPPSAPASGASAPGGYREVDAGRLGGGSAAPAVPLAAPEFGPTDFPGQNECLPQLNPVTVDDLPLAASPTAPGFLEHQNDDIAIDPWWFWDDNEPRCAGSAAYGGSFTWTFERSGWRACEPPPITEDVNWGTWRPALDCDGTYAVVAWIPNCGGDEQVDDAIYKLYTSDAALPAAAAQIDQRDPAGDWRPLFTHHLNADGNDYVYLGDRTADTPGYLPCLFGDDRIAFDALEFRYEGPTPKPPAERAREHQCGKQDCADPVGDPVVPSIGNLLHQVEDVRIPFRGPVGLELERTYNSRIQRVGLFGYGWSSVLDMQVRLYADDSVDVWFPDGQTRSWSWNGSAYVPFPGVFDVLVRTPSGWELTTPDQLKYYFDDIFQGGYVGRLRRIEDRHANGVTFNYDFSKMPVNATDDAGRRLTFTNEDGHITSMTDPLGRLWRYDYDADLLTTTTDAKGGVTRYTHDGNGFVATITDPGGILFLRNVYDADGRVLEQRDASNSLTTFLYGASSTTVTDVLGRVTVYSHDAQLRRSSRLDAMGYTQEWDHPANTTLARYTDRRGNSWLRTHDSRGNVLNSQCPTGCTTDFTYNATNDLLTITNALSHTTTFTWTGGNLTAIDFPDGGHVEMTYDGFGQILTRTDQNGHTTSFVHDTYGNQIRETDPLGNATSQEFDIVGRRIALVDANLHRTEFTHDPNDNVETVTDPKGGVITMEYDANDLMVAMTDRRGGRWTFEHDIHLRLTRSTDPEGHARVNEYDIVQRRTAAIDGRNARTTFRYDPLDRIREIEDALGGVTVLTLDPNGNTLVARDPEGHETTTEYDPRNLPTRVTDALSGFRETEYDALGRVIRVRDERGAITRHGYDAVDRLITTTDPLGIIETRGYDLAGNLLTVTNGRAATTRFEYDAANRLIRETDPEGHAVTLGLDGVGNVVLHRNARGFETRLAHDENDNLWRVTDALGGVLRFEHDAEDARTAVIDQRGHRTEFGLDADGVLETITEPGGLVTRFTHDGEHDLVGVRNAKGNLTESLRDPLGRVTTVRDPLGNETLLAYDRDGLVTTRTDANSHVTEFGHDALHRLATVTDAIGGLTAYGYDPGGLLTSIVDANGHETVFEHDLAGRLIREENAIGGTWRYVRDAVGNVVQLTDANGRITRYEHDLDDQLTGKIFPRYPATRFIRDQNHNITEVRDRLGRITQTFDALDRLSTSRDSVGQQVENTYDAEGHRTSFKFPDGRTMRYVIDPNDRVQEVVDPEGGRFLAQYDATHQLTLLTSPNGTAASHAYDAADRLTSLSNRRTDGTVLSAFSYVLDGVGNRIRTTESHIDELAIVQHDYRHDALDRLVHSHDTKGRFTDYEYDAVGNRVRFTSNHDPHRTPTGVAPYTIVDEFDAADRLLRSVHSVLGTTTYQNDANGNRTRQEGAGEFSGAAGQRIRRDYQHDDENRLARVNDYQLSRGRWSPRGITTLSHDGFGRLFQRDQDERASGGGRRWSVFAYDGLDPILELIRPGTRSVTYHRGIGGLLSSRAFPGTGAGPTSYYHRDGLGSTSVMTNHLGQSAHVYRYLDYGTIVDVNGRAADASAFTNPHNAFCYTGQEFAQGLRLHHFYAREYDSIAARWVQQDVFRGYRGRPASLNRFAYVEGNPVAWVDPLGFERGRPVPLVDISWQYKTTTPAFIPSRPTQPVTRPDVSKFPRTKYGPVDPRVLEAPGLKRWDGLITPEDQMRIRLRQVELLQDEDLLRKTNLERWPLTHNEFWGATIGQVAPGSAPPIGLLKTAEREVIGETYGQYTDEEMRAILVLLGFEAVNSLEGVRDLLREPPIRIPPVRPLYRLPVRR